MLLATHTPLGRKKGVWEEEKGGGRCVCVRGNSGVEAGEEGCEERE